MINVLFKNRLCSKFISFLFIQCFFIFLAEANPAQLQLVRTDPPEKRVGIFMGTFDPPHYGHIEVALNAIKEAGLDRVILIPNFDAPHKPKATSSLHRLNMTWLAAQDHPQLHVVDVEQFAHLFDLKLTKGSHAVYKYFLKTLHPKTLVFQISGSDIIDRYGHQIDALQINHPRLNILLTHRPDEGDIDQAFVEQYKSKIIQLAKPSPEVSSTSIRKLVGQNYDDLLPLNGKLHPDVLRYIAHNRLYAPEAPQKVSDINNQPSGCSEALKLRKVGQ